MVLGLVISLVLVLGCTILKITLILLLRTVLEVLLVLRRVVVLKMSVLKRRFGRGIAGNRLPRPLLDMCTTFNGTILRHLYFRHLEIDTDENLHPI